MQVTKQSLYSRAFVLGQCQPDQVLLSYCDIEADAEAQTISIKANSKTLRAIRTNESELLPGWTINKIAT